jgi:hypothetical protein
MKVEASSKDVNVEMGWQDHKIQARHEERGKYYVNKLYKQNYTWFLYYH